MLTPSIRTIRNQIGNRSAFLPFMMVGLWLTGSFITQTHVLAQPAPHQAKPNIIFIMADDLGWGDVGFNGQKEIKTPHLDRLASEGMVFDQFYSGCTVCAPSRAAFLTGMHTGHVWQRFNGQIQFREDPLDRTIASILRDGGYQTAMIGKSGLACNSDDAGLPNRKGFDHFFGFLGHGAAHRHFPSSLVRNGQEVRFPKNHDKNGEQISGDLFVEETLTWLDAASSKGPFFLHLSLQQPHADLVAPEEFVEPYVGKFSETPFPDGQHYRANAHPVATYAGMVTHLDHSVGRVIEKLQELGIAENTLVMFTSDNGPHREGGMNPATLKSSGPFRGHKRDLYEGGIRVPTLAWWPGKIKSGGRTDHVAAFWDFPATAVELAGLEPLLKTDGISFAPTLLGNPGQAAHDFLYWEFHEQGGKQAVRMGQWKGIRLNLQQPAKTSFELYNLSDDPAEQRDVSATHADVVEKILSIMVREHEPTDRVSLQKGVLQKNVKPAQPGGKKKNPVGDRN
jgi:arylsulfatase A-like enzyme